MPYDRRRRAAAKACVSAQRFANRFSLALAGNLPGGWHRGAVLDGAEIQLAPTANRTRIPSARAIGDYDFGPRRSRAALADGQPDANIAAAAEHAGHRAGDLHVGLLVVPSADCKPTAEIVADASTMRAERPAVRLARQSRNAPEVSPRPTIPLRSSRSHDAFRRDGPDGKQSVDLEQLSKLSRTQNRAQGHPPKTPEKQRALLQPAAVSENTSCTHCSKTRCRSWLWAAFRSPSSSAGC